MLVNKKDKKKDGIVVVARVKEDQLGNGARFSPPLSSESTGR